jgi:hypothetical protein
MSSPSPSPSPSSSAIIVLDMCSLMPMVFCIYFCVSKNSPWMGRVYAYVVNYSTRSVDLVCRWSLVFLYVLSFSCFFPLLLQIFLTAGLSRDLLYKSYRRHTNVADRIQHRLACYSINMFIDVCCCYSGSLRVLLL